MRHIFAALALAAGVALSGTAANALPIGKPAVSQKSDVVHARHGGHGGFRHGGIGIRHGGGHGIRHGGFGHRHFYRPRIYVAPLYGGYAFRDGCYWLKRKAIRTGSRYWWRRYNACRWG